MRWAAVKLALGCRAGRLSPRRPYGWPHAQHAFQAFRRVVSNNPHSLPDAHSQARHRTGGRSIPPLTNALRSYAPLFLCILAAVSLLLVNCVLRSYRSFISSQIADGSKQVRFHGASVESQHIGNLVETQSVIVAQGKNSALPVRHFPQAPSSSRRWICFANSCAPALARCLRHGENQLFVFRRRSPPPHLPRVRPQPVRQESGYPGHPLSG